MPPAPSETRTQDEEMREFCGPRIFTEFRVITSTSSVFRLDAIYLDKLSLSRDKRIIDKYFYAQIRRHEICPS